MLSKLRQTLEEEYHETDRVFDMYWQPCASADGVGGSKQTSDEVGKEDGERSLNIARWRPRHESRGTNENIARRRPRDKSRDTNEIIARLFRRANAHESKCE